MNLVKARVNGEGSTATLDIQSGKSARVSIPLPSATVATLKSYVGQEVIAGIRAEAVSLARDGMVAGADQCFVEAHVEVIEPTGADTLVVLDMGGSEFTVRLEPDVSLKPDQQARFLIDLSKLVCFDAKTETLIA